MLRRVNAVTPTKERKAGTYAHSSVLEADFAPGSLQL